MQRFYAHKPEYCTHLRSKLHPDVHFAAALNVYTLTWLLARAVDTCSRSCSLVYSAERQAATWSTALNAKLQLGLQR